MYWIVVCICVSLWFCDIVCLLASLRRNILPVCCTRSLQSWLQSGVLHLAALEDLKLHTNVYCWWGHFHPITEFFLLNQLKPVLWKNKSVEKLLLFFMVSFISSKFGRVNSSNRIAPTWDEVICSYLTVEQKDLILVLQWLILSIWLKFTHLKLHHVGQSLFNHEVFPDIVMTESNLQVLSSHNSHWPFQEV